MELHWSPNVNVNANAIANANANNVVDRQPRDTG